MASIEKKEKVVTTEVVYILTLNQEEIDVLRTMMYYNLAGTSHARDGLEDAILPHGMVRSEWINGAGGGTRVWTA